MFTGLKRFGRALFVAAIVTGAGTASAATVSFSAIVDGSGGSLFNAGSTTANNTDTLAIGIGNFSASSGLKTDTISFTVTALPNHVITGISYTESGSFSVTGGGVFYSANLTLPGIGTPQGGSGSITGSGFGGTWSLQPLTYSFGSGISTFNVVISDTLAAFGSASVAKTAASLSVTTAPVPVPGALWLMGTALLGFVGISRRR